jgi:uncharacterized protein (TIGR02145 family)
MKMTINLFLLISLLIVILTCKKDSDDSNNNSNNNNSSGKVTDADGNVYNTVIIGTQCWMKENLKTTKYNDSTAIPNVTDNTAWVQLSTPGYCFYNNDVATYKNTYGALYNWYAVNTGKLCPAGWHVPSDAEWQVLVDYLGGDHVAGGKLKSTSGWNSPNTGATNSSGFTALPGGNRGDGSWYKGYSGTWWSSTEEISTHAWERNLGWNSSDMYKYASGKYDGYSVRCVRD